MASTLRNWLEKRAELLIVGAFSVAFIVGFGLFAATGSLELAAAAIGIGAVGVPALLRQVVPKKLMSADTPTIDSRLKFLEAAHQTSEVRLLTLETKAPPVTASDFDRLAIKLGALERQLNIIDSKINDQSFKKMPLSHQQKKNPLNEITIRKSLGSGQIKVESVEIESRMTGRFAYRFVVMKCDYINGDLLSENDLREAEVSADVIKFFDRVRVAFAYNMTLQDGSDLEAPIHLCPIGKEILSDPQGVADIRSVMERSPSIKNKLGLVLPSDPSIMPRYNCLS